MKAISTLVEDIYAVFDGEVRISPEEASAFGEDLARVVVEQFEPRQKYLRLSNLGNSCTRQLWYSINTPELAERMPGAARIKFLIGHITEAVVLFLARLAGHSVTDEQRKVSLHGVHGHIDALVDGELVDVKSASPYSFVKFKEGITPQNDAFGYLTQLYSYATSLGHKRAHFLPVDKVLGKLHLDSHDVPEVDYETKVNHVRGVLESNVPPERSFDDEPDGASGNRKLGTKCSYCEFKRTCFPGLQEFKYSRGPVFLTRVVRQPKVEKVEE